MVAILGFLEDNSYRISKGNEVYSDVIADFQLLGGAVENPG